MRSSPSIVPLDRLDREIYLVLEHFGVRAGCTWRETDEADTDLETVIRHILSGEYTYPFRVVAFNPSEGWSRDATSDVADAVAHRAVDTDTEVSPALQAFITANSSRIFDVQLSLPLPGAARIQGACIRPNHQGQHGVPSFPDYRVRPSLLFLQ